MAKEFLGVGFSFPVVFDESGAIATAQYEESVRQSIWIILGTAKGERVMRPDFGCGIYDLVFEVEIRLDVRPESHRRCETRCCAQSRASTFIDVQVERRSMADAVRSTSNTRCAPPTTSSISSIRSTWSRSAALIVSSAPAIDPRTAAAVAEQLQQLLKAYAPGWNEVDPVTGAPIGRDAALIGIFARSLREIVIQRLNQVPEKNFLAYLDLLGARVAAAAAGEGAAHLLARHRAASWMRWCRRERRSPHRRPRARATRCMFETERELPVVAATLQSLITVDAERDLVADHSALLASPDAAGAAIFSGDRSNEHLLYIGHSAGLTAHKVTQLTVTLQLNAQPAENQREILPADLRWEVWDGTTWSAIAPANVVQPANLSGEFRFSNLPTMPALTLSGISSHWLRCRLLKPVSPGATAAVGMLQASLLPVLDAAKVRATAARSAITPDAAFANAQAIDVTKPFLPFGERPKLGDAFYVGSSEGFGLPGARVFDGAGGCESVARTTGARSRGAESNAALGSVDQHWMEPAR